MKNGFPIKFKVEKGIPLPPVQYAGSPKKYDWPFMTMKVGECFFVPCLDVHDARRVRGRIYQAAHLYTATGRRFNTRLMPGDKRIGVWRVQ